MFNLFKKARKIDLPTSFLVPKTKYRKAIYPSYERIKNSNRYCTKEDIYSVIRYLATTAALIPLYAYDEEKEPEQEITQLLKEPSLLQSGFEFYESLYSFLFLEGEAIIIISTLDVGVNAGKKHLSVVNPNEIAVMVDEVGNINGYQRLRNGMVTDDYEPEEVIHIKYFNPSPEEVRGLSPLKVLLKNSTLSDAQKDMMVSQAQNGGVNDIIFDKTSFEEGPAVMNSRKSSFMKFIKDPANKGAPYFANGEMQGIKLGSTVADMQLIESMKISFKKICNVYGTSDILFNSDSASTESNVKEMTSRTYTNTILPNVKRVVSAIEIGLGLKGSGIYVKEDISNIPELRTDMTALVNSLSLAWWLTPNDKLEAMNYERNPNPLFDEPFIPAGVMPLADYIPPALQDDPFTPPDENEQ